MMMAMDDDDLAPPGHQSLDDNGSDNDELDFEDFGRVPRELTSSDSPRVEQMLLDFAEALVLLRPTLQNWHDMDGFGDEGGAKSATMHPHRIAAEADVALYGLLGGGMHDHHHHHSDDDQEMGESSSAWSVAEVTEFLDAARALILALLPSPHTAEQVILPAMRAAFPLPVYSAAVLKLSRDGSSHGDSPTSGEKALCSPRLLSWIGRGLKPSDMPLLGEMAVTIARYATDPSIIASGTPTSVQELRFMAPWTRVPNEAQVYLRRVLVEAAGWNPLMVASCLSGMFEAYGSASDMAALALTLFPDLAEYEAVHGDFALMLRSLHRLPLSPVPDFTQFLGALLDGTSPRTSTELAHFFHHPQASQLSATAPLSTDPAMAMVMTNAIAQGSAPLHVRLAFETISPAERVPAALSMLRFGYEDPLAACMQYRLSSRLNDWRSFATPTRAVAIVAAVLGSYNPPSSFSTGASSEKTATAGDSSDFVTFAFAALQDCDFGFSAPDETDETEFRARDGVLSGADDDLFSGGHQYRGDVGSDDEEVELWAPREEGNLCDGGSGSPPSLDTATLAMLLDGDDNADDEFEIGDAFLARAMHLIEAADGDIGAIHGDEIDGLVDQLMAEHGASLRE
ncbi:hypothetical protein BC828DRAFT_402155 [Blastocladiella britannica]|nr:hypothetical protein BC828DRAFT_402155 [Blastocladiella britannica]